MPQGRSIDFGRRHLGQGVVADAVDLTVELFGPGQVHVEHQASSRREVLPRALEEGIEVPYAVQMRKHVEGRDDQGEAPS